MPNCRVEFAAEAGPDERTYRVNRDEIRRVLPDFQPKWTTRKGAAELYQAYRRIALHERIRTREKCSPIDA